MLLAKNLHKNKRLFLVIGIVAVANLSIMATFPKLHLSTDKKVHSDNHFIAAKQIIQKTLLPIISKKYQQDCSYQLQKNSTCADACFFTGEVIIKKHHSYPKLPFKVFPKHNRVLVLDTRTRKYIDLKTWLKK
ncbi:hypothetical protein [uncultured Microscilla sp.]|uniref:hypothetical protein n=1 Tax=uncultured Microscilla sp. TaxID=432653 RepID=UPI00262D0262|nr:hypothetical protein [uncultured Microscilla sp.]